MCAVAIEFNRKILLLGRGGLGGGGEGYGVNGGEGGVHGIKKIHSDRVWCVVRRLENWRRATKDRWKCGCRKTCSVLPKLIHVGTEDSSVYPAMDTKEAEWRWGWSHVRLSDSV